MGIEIEAFCFSKQKERPPHLHGKHRLTPLVSSLERYDAGDRVWSLA